MIPGPDHDPLHPSSDEPFWETCLILRVRSGSHVYGLAVASAICSPTVVSVVRIGRSASRSSSGIWSSTQLRMYAAPFGPTGRLSPTIESGFEAPTDF